MITLQVRTMPNLHGMLDEKPRWDCPLSTADQHIPGVSTSQSFSS